MGTMFSRLQPPMAASNGNDKRGWNKEYALLNAISARLRCTINIASGTRPGSFLIASFFYLAPNFHPALLSLPSQPPPKLKPFSKTLTFLDFPTLIRNTIYSHALLEPEPILTDENTWLEPPSLVRFNEVKFSHGRWCETLSPATLKAATQIRNEAASIFYKDNIFYAKEATAARNWLSSVRRSVQLEIDHIRLHTEDGITPRDFASDVFDEKWLEREETHLRWAGRLVGSTKLRDDVLRCGMYVDGEAGVTWANMAMMDQLEMPFEEERWILTWKDDGIDKPRED